MKEKTMPVPTEQGKELVTPPPTREEERFLIPPVDIFETKEGLTVVVDLPGVTRDGIDVRVDQGTLTIQGKTRRTDLGNRLYTEFSLLDYYRQFELSDEVDRDKIAAELSQGVLTLHLPKVAAAMPKTIMVKVA